MTQWPENRGGLYEMTEEISKVFNSETMEQIHNTSQGEFYNIIWGGSLQLTSYLFLKPPLMI
jgi:hypothetical protein